ncbi:hypothetical protein P280DRAFT_12410 [Massarina eburnea CBS 473.64]|uniref:Uncharacterized protein n=1 Tax=Massarina eburnea CBS 473.64 TaxID=1395130 RepID=A0A6A6SG02_9PLEO|nr:hypothetical protein P280DRAFT_12410 [Massarina eburnea CBS 473.64]
MPIAVLSGLSTANAVPREATWTLSSATYYYTNAVPIMYRKQMNAPHVTQPTDRDTKELLFGTSAPYLCILRLLVTHIKAKEHPNPRQKANKKK